MLHSFRARLLSGFAVVIILTLILSASVVTLLLREQQAEAAEARIGVLVGPITNAARAREELGWPTQLIRAELTSAAAYYDIRILMLDSDDRVVIDTARSEPLLGQILDVAFTQPVAAQGQMSTFRTQRQRIGDEDLYLFTNSSGPGGEIRDEVPGLQLIIAVPAGDVAGAWARLLPRLSVAGIGAALVAVVFSLVFASRVTTPLAQITHASEAMGRGDLDQRINVDGEDEVGRLATAFNTMSARISRSDRSMRDLLANVSHELRTPLTSIQGFSQAISDGVAGDPREAAVLINEEADRIRRLVDDLLYLSEIESGTVHLDLEDVDIDGLIEGTLRRLRLQAEEGEVELVAVPGAGTIRADGRRLEQVLANLVDNAIRFAPRGTPVTVTGTQVADGVLVEVHNGGEPIPEADRTRVFDRFYQVDRARRAGRHRGLGLAIVHELVQAHGGTVAVDSSAERGTTFSVFLPLAAQGGPTPRTGDRAN